jgi:O-methyltransferase involved in polyketide biosynthesis
MTRSDDSWDIQTGVGSTAVIVTALRAEEARSANPLVRKEFAELLISAPTLRELRETISSGRRREGDIAPDA